MYTILMDALCLDCHSELLLNAGANIEAIVESTLALVLLDFFGEVVVIEGVRVIGAPITLNQPTQHLLQIHATSLNEALEMPVDLLEARLEEAICCALLEHFHTVVINAIDVQPQTQ
jgi:hypothetical protein